MPAAPVKPARRRPAAAESESLTEFEEKLLAGLYALRKAAGRQTESACLYGVQRCHTAGDGPQKPLSLDELLNITGVGEKKAARYGVEFLRLIEDAVESRS